MIFLPLNHSCRVSLLFLGLINHIYLLYASLIDMHQARASSPLPSLSHPLVPPPLQGERYSQRVLGVSEVGFGTKRVGGVED